ncbi:MAG: tetratricopeptide repeat protein [Acidobacteria bacterium]|nr:tetratricopeptide repeat protein [Acidobacteriota bacterium]
MPRLRVMSLAAVARYKGKPPDPLAVRRDLGAEKVLTGRLAQRGDDLAITIELVDSRDNSHVWGQQYNRKLAGILTLQEEISRDVTDQLRLRLSGADRKRLTKRYTDNAEAYQLYLKGRYYSDLFTKDGALKGLDYYRQALAKDPRYALAYAGIADSWIIFADWYLSPSESIPKAKEAAEQALRIDDALAEAHTSLGIIACSYDWNWTASEAEFRRALELNPRYARAISFYGWHLLVTGKTEEGIREMKRAFETEPQPEAGGFLSLGLQFVRQHDQAIEYARKTLAIDPNFYIAHVSLGLALEQKRQFQDAAAAFESAARLFDSPWILAQIARVRAVAGNRAEARQRLEHLLKLKTERYVAPLDIASVYLGLGQNDQAMAWLEKAFIDRNGFLIYLRTDPLLDGLRSDPRFQDLVRRMRFP